MSQSTVRDVSRGGFYLGLEQLTMVVGGVLYSIMVLRMLGPAVYGILMLGQATIGLAGVLTTNVEAYLERFVAEIDARGHGGTLGALVRKILSVKGLLAIGAGILVAALADPIATAYGYRDLRRLLPALAPLVLLECLILVFRYTLFGLQRFRLIWIVAVANTIVKLTIVLILWRLGEGVVALVAGLVAVQGLTAAGMGILVLRALPSQPEPTAEVPTYRRIWKYVLPLFGARIFFLSGQHLNKLILGILLSAHDLGLAAFALMTIERFIGLAAAVPNALLPALSRLRGEGKKETIEQVVTEGFRLVGALAVALSAGIFCLAREAVLITGGPEFLGALMALQILALVPLFRTIQQPLNMSFYTYEKTRVVFWLAALKFAVEPLLYPVLIPSLGVSGVALASLLSSVVVFGPAIRVAAGLFPSTAANRRRTFVLAWVVGGAVMAVGWAFRGLDEPWPSLAVRILLLVLALFAVIAVRMVSGNDLRRFGEATHRPRVEALFRRLAGAVDRIQARPYPVR
ncbi:MAG: oligosaccharide flippase family protein [Candidatus Eisenbacteria bacterium]|nr:oligosaccharide flippase family protein [Candidatus Latescibacterota bacterium]MBD3300906.1 oligosaccharide flippase family protein [Candidatus Eisenbacteria bacterium]